MIIAKYTKQKMEVIKKTLPDLLATLQLHFPYHFKMDSEFKGDLGIIAGLIIEYVLKSGGSADIFQDTDLSDFTTEDYNLID